MNVVVVTSVAEKTPPQELERCIASVRAQTHPHTRHVLVLDGPLSPENAVLLATVGHDVETIALPKATGSGGYNGHLSYAASAFIVGRDDEHIAFLDADNYFREDHIQGLAAAFAAKRSTPLWGHSLRTIIDGDGSVVCRDSCESLGILSHTCLGEDDRLVDLNCFLISVPLCRQLAGYFNVKARPSGGVLEVDRALIQALLQLPPHFACCSLAHSVYYKVGNRADSVQAGFFARGNAMLHRAMEGKEPDLERCPPVYVFHFNEAATRRALAAPAAHRNPLEDYEPCMYLHFHRRCTLFDGYKNAKHIPHGATVFCALCHPSDLPLDLLKQRKDLKRVCYAVEGPNLYHKDQYARAFLESHFDIVFTYFAPLLATSPSSKTEYVRCPYPGRFDFPLHAPYLQTNGDETHRSVCMVLARRGGHAQYEIDGVRLRQLDALREKLVVDMRGVTVFGAGWAELAGEYEGRGMCPFLVGDAGVAGKHRDPVHAIGRLKDHTFALIIENCDGEGYTSEKVFDALAAGCIPVYYGDETLLTSLDVPFVSLRSLKTLCGRGVQGLLDAMTDEEIRATKELVVARRERILQSVGLKTLADAIVPRLCSSA